MLLSARAAFSVRDLVVDVVSVEVVVVRPAG
jgi:hypothetical protein